MKKKKLFIAEKTKFFMSFAFSQVNYNPESETLNVNLHKFKYCPDQLTKNGVIVK